MSFASDDCIAALASAPGPGGRGIVRVSGTETRRTLDRFFFADDQEQWRSLRTAARHRGSVKIQGAPAPLPIDVYLWPQHRSYTGQPLAELHLVGSPPLLEAILSELYSRGARPAQPGEFTLRAFLAGRIDLTQAEAVLGVVDAHSHRELETALAQLAGGLSGQLARVRADLLDLLADLEAGLDFVDEDIEFVSPAGVLGRLGSARTELESLLQQAAERIQSTGRMQVVLAGPPNAGKSTLFNALAGREAALVSEVAGTTRDYLSVRLEWDDVSVELFDTAGWESAAGGIASLAQVLRDEQTSRADLVLWCAPADLDEQSGTLAEALRGQLVRDDRPLLTVATKCDLGAADHAADVRVSAKSGQGMGALIAAAAGRLTEQAAGARQFVGMTAARCRESLSAAVHSLRQAESAAEIGAGDEIVALEVRESLQHLGSILGAVYTDDVLDRIFSRFCIGK